MNAERKQYYIVSVDEVRAADLNSEFWGVPTILLMENAGAGVAQIAYRKARDLSLNERVAVVAGSGGKAGDGFVAARHLLNHGFSVNIYLTSRVIKHPDALRNFKILKNLFGVSIRKYEAGMKFDEDIVIDALLGTGVRGAPRGVVADAIRSINSSKCFKISIDVPSGVDPETGEVPGDAVKADVTATMAAVKPGLLKAKEYVGELHVINIGTPRNAFLAVGPGDVKVWFRQKATTAKKGDGGRVLVFTGSSRYVGAPWLTALAAWRAGADLVFLAAPKDVVEARFSPEIIAVGLKGETLGPGHVDAILREGLLSKCDAVVAGPGLGLTPETTEFIRKLISATTEYRIPIILDADALKALPHVKVGPLNAVLTPHLGEASVLLNRKLSPPGTVEERVSVAKEVSAKYGCVTVLKGYIDVIASPDGRHKLRVGVGHQDMSCGGTGDVLAGLIATAVARSRDLFRAACIAAFLNAAAGEYAYLVGGKASPIEILKYVPEIIKDPIGFSRKLLKLREEVSS